MKKTLLTLAIALLALAAQAQSSLKVHSNGILSIQSSSTSGGVQFQTDGFTSFEPSVSGSYARLQQTIVNASSSKCWIVKDTRNQFPHGDMFYVTGNGSVYCYYLYYIQAPSRGKGYEPIGNASELIARMNGYYSDSDEFSGNPEDLVDNENVAPEAVEGLLRDMEKTRSVTMNAEELEEVLPEAVRHTAEGSAGINYNAVIAVLVEAFKEQQARIEQMEDALRENGLLR